MDPILADIKAEAEEIEEEPYLDAHLANLTPEANIDTRGRPGKCAKQARRTVNLGVSEDIATTDCRTAVLDREFDNPPHRSCYYIGGCDRCVEHCRQDNEADRHAKRRLLIKEEDSEHHIKSSDEPEHKKPPNKRNPNMRYGELRTRFTDGLLEWRNRKFLELVQLYDTESERIMTLSELTSIAKTKGIDDTSAFDRGVTHWPGPSDWRLEVLEVLEGLQKDEDDRIAREAAMKQEETGRKAKEKANQQRQAATAKAEREHKAEESRIERAQKEVERGRKMAERQRQAAETQMEREQKAITAADSRLRRITGGMAGGAGAFFCFRLVSTPDYFSPSTPRAVGHVRVSTSGQSLSL